MSQARNEMLFCLPAAFRVASSECFSNILDNHVPGFQQGCVSFSLWLPFLSVFLPICFAGKKHLEGATSTAKS